MFATARKLCSFSRPSHHAISKFNPSQSFSSQISLEKSIRSAIESKNYLEIPNLLNSTFEQSPVANQSNPFQFLSTFPETHRTHLIDDILQSFIPIRPRSKPRIAYSCLLSLILENPNPLPLALAVLQRMLRSGLRPAPQTHLSLSNAWLKERDGKTRNVHSILSKMNSIGYSIDSGTCNYLITSLCKADQSGEATKVLHGMFKAGCLPDRDSYGALIIGMSERGMTSEVLEMIKEMVCEIGFSPRQEVVIKAVDSIRASGDARRGVELIEFLEREGICVGFEAYEKMLEGCLDSGRFVLAGKFAVTMTERGFIPYIEVRQRVVEGLVCVGESEFASVVRQRFARLKS